MTADADGDDKGNEMTQTDSIESSGFPLAFKVRQGKARPCVVAGKEGRDILRTEARQLAGHQKEAVVTEGDDGTAWRMVSDEGPHIKGTDLAPFPLGFFNAGLQSDLINRILAAARARSLPVSDVRLFLRNSYYMTGSFFRGDGHGYGEPAKIVAKVTSTAPAEEVARLVRDAVNASPALAAMRTPLVNTFALYVNGRRRKVETMPASDAPDAADPYMTYSRPPAPLAESDELRDIIVKTGQKEEGQPQPAPAGTKTRIIRNVDGVSRLIDPAGVTETDTWLVLPGMSHFAFKADERPEGDQAPSGLALLTAGVAFCYMTQLSRYIEHMKFKIRAVRLVQFSPYRLSGAPSSGSWTGQAEPVDTHLFLSGEETEETYEQLMNIAARTCYLHATLGSALEPDVTVEQDEMAVS